MAIERLRYWDTDGILKVGPLWLRASSTADAIKVTNHCQSPPSSSLASLCPWLEGMWCIPSATLCGRCNHIYLRHSNLESSLSASSTASTSSQSQLLSCNAQQSMEAATCHAHRYTNRWQSVAGSRSRSRRGGKL